jgi:uncharacterized protein YeaO (DUF488 family)
MDVMILTKSVHTVIEPDKDGLRILAARFRGRGMPKDRYDIWMANLGPSEKLLRAFQNGDVNWQEFARQYREELFESSPIDKRNELIKNHGQKFTLRLIQQLAKKGAVTVMCHCAEEQRHCHRHVLQRILRGKV